MSEKLTFAADCFAFCRRLGPALVVLAWMLAGQMNASPNDPGTTSKGLERFLRLAFGDPHVTPTRDEHAMYMAFATSFKNHGRVRLASANLAPER